MGASNPAAKEAPVHESHSVGVEYMLSPQSQEVESSPIELP
jgi:hypothetical protein